MPVYPLGIPEGIGFSKAKWGLKRSVAISESPFTGKQQTYQYQYALWTATLSLPPMNNILAGRWTAFIIKLQGRRGTFLLGNPDYKLKGAASDKHVLATDIEVGANSISLRTLYPRTPNTYRAGDFIQIGAGATANLYMVTDDANTSQNKIVSINIEPSIRAAASAETEINYTNPKAVFRMDKNDITWDTDKNRIYTITFSCTEAVA